MAKDNPIIVSFPAVDTPANMYLFIPKASWEVVPDEDGRNIILRRVEEAPF